MAKRNVATCTGTPSVFAIVLVHEMPKPQNRCVPSPSLTPEGPWHQPLAARLWVVPQSPSPAARSRAFRCSSRPRRVLHTRSNTSTICFGAEAGGKNSEEEVCLALPSAELEGVGDTGVRAPAHPSPFGAQANGPGHLPQQQHSVPPAAVESGASMGVVGAALVRFCPVTETLGT